MTMIQFLNKHANGYNTILGYWFEDSDLEGRTDYEIIRKCVWLLIHHNIELQNIFSKDKLIEFMKDYTQLALDLKIDIIKIEEEM